MPVEFKCQNCGALLRVPDSALGMQAKCPQCATVQNVPTGAPAASELPPTGAPYWGSPPPKELRPVGPPATAPALQPGQYPNEGAKVGSGAAGHVPAFAPPAPEKSSLFNPYQAPPTDSTPPANSVPEVAIPAVGLIVHAVFGILTAAWFAFSVAAQLATQGRLGGPPREFQNEAEATGFIVGQVVAVVLMVGLPAIMHPVILTGAILMLRRKSYTFAFIASLLAIVPCSCCFPMGLVFGIWGLVILNNAAVRSQFN